jgi:hypothetical protein
MKKLKEVNETKKTMEENEEVVKGWAKERKRINRNRKEEDKKDGGEKVQKNLEQKEDMKRKVSESKKNKTLKQKVAVLCHHQACSVRKPSERKTLFLLTGMKTVLR